MAMHPQLPITEDSKVTVVTGEDWTGVYINGVLVTQNHSVSARDFLESLGFEVAYAEMPQRYTDLGRPLPEQLTEL